MKKNNMKVYAFIVAMALILNMVMPSVAFAEELLLNTNSITLSVERRVLGEADIVSEREVKLSGTEESVANLVVRAFDQLGIKYKNTGNAESSFYLSEIETDNGPLGEFDHGSNSGWLYYVNDKKYEIGMSDYKVKNGDKLSIKYTAKDFGGDILAVESIEALRTKVEEAKKISGAEYTDESFNLLTTVINTAENKLPTNEEIGKMMSVALGSGECETAAYKQEMDRLSNNIQVAIDALEKRPEGPVLTPDFSIDLFNGQWEAFKKDINHRESNDFNTIYLDSEEDSKVVELARMKSTYKPRFNGQAINEVNGKYVVELKEGINTLSIERWGFDYFTTISVKKLSYEIKGDAIPGGTVTLKLNGVTQPVENMIKYYEIQKTRANFSTDIPGLSEIQSETIYGANVDMDKISTITFTIPEGTEPGEYNINGGSIYQDWDGISSGGVSEGNYSVFPNIKLTVTDKIDISKGYDIELSTWTEYDKVYTLEDTTILRLKNIDEASNVTVNGNVAPTVDGVKMAQVNSGENIINVDGQEYKVFCKKISYTISGVNAILPGTTVEVKFNGIEEAFTYISGVVNPQEIRAEFNTNINGVDRVASENAGSHTYVDREKLNTITFKVPEDSELGEYTLFDGGIYQSWYGQELPGAVEVDGKWSKSFSILPRVTFTVRDTVLEDKEAPQITTTLKDNETIGTIKKSFKVMVTDNVDSNIKPIVRVNGEEVASKNESYNVILNEGKNTIELEATDKSGNTTKEVYTINVEIKLRAGASIILDTINLKLNIGESHKLIAVDTPDYRSTENDDTAPMTYKVVEGEDIVTVDNNGVIKALKSGFANISVRYPGLITPAIVSVHVTYPNENIEIETTINEDKYDTVHYVGDSYKYSFKAEADGSEITVYHDGSKLEKDSEGFYTADLKEGYNIIKIEATNGGASSYLVKNIRAKKVSYEITNVTNPGMDIIQGDRVSIKFNGLETPVPKFLRVYNPKNTRVLYDVNMAGMTNIYGKGTQYDISSRNDIEFVATEAGTFEFTNGVIDEQWWGDVLYSEREITGETPNLSAIVRHDRFSKLPSFEINVLENPNFKNKYQATVKDEDSIKPGDEVVIRIENLDMPATDAYEILQAKTIFNSDIKGLEVIESKDASNKAENLKEISFKLPEDIEAGTYTITNGRVYKEWIGLSSALYQENEFYKGELPEIKITVQGDEGQVEPPTEEQVEVAEEIAHGAKWILENVKSPGYEDEWKILGLVRGGIDVPEEYYQDYYNNLEEVVIEKKGKLHRSKYTEYSRVILTLTALGYNPTDVGGYNLVEKLYDLKNISKQGINGVIFALIALDTKDFEIEGNKNSREMMVDYILERQLEDGGFALSGSNGEVDITAMAIQALAKYTENPKVEIAIDKALDFLSKVQLKTGAFAGIDGQNIESTAQVLVAINSLGISASDSRFVKNNNTVVDAIRSFMTEEGGFKHLLTDENANGMATEQAVYALVAQDRLNKGKTTLYDMSDVEGYIKPTPDTVNKEKLEKLIKAVESIDIAIYTEESASILKDKLVTAKEVFNNSDATQEEVDKAIAELQYGVDSLVKKEDSTGSGEDGSKPEPDSGDKDNTKPGNGNNNGGSGDKENSKLPATGAAVSSQVIVVVSIVLLLVGGVMLKKRSKK